LTDLPDYYEDSDLLPLLKERIKVHIKGLSKEFPTNTREDAHKIVGYAVDISNVELDTSIDGVWVPQVVMTLKKNENGPDVIQLEIRSFCRVGAGIN
jgi:hypothetical protein